MEFDAVKQVMIIEWKQKKNKCEVAKDPRRLKTKQKWSAKETKSTSLPKSTSGDLTAQFY